MTEFAQQIVGAAWEDAGRRVAPSLDGRSAAIVVGDDPVVAAHAALGIARAQAVGRRVAVADLVGDVAPLQDQVSGEDAHGITDSFRYGVSLSRIARQVDAGGTLFVLPSGTEPEITADVLRSERWRLLADSFGKAGALLLLVARADAEGLEELARYVDGAVLVGDADPRGLGDARVLAVVAPPRTGAYTPILAPTPVPPGEAMAGSEPAPVAAGPRRSLVPYLVVGLIVAGLAGWFLRPRPEPALDAPAVATTGQPGAPPVPAPGTPAGGGQPAPDSATSAAAAAAAAAARDTLAGGLTLVNAADSTRAATFTVLLSTFPTPGGVRLRLEQDSPDVPAATMAPVRTPTGERYQYLAGAYTTSAEADSLLRVLRRRAAVGTRGGSVVGRPFGFVVRDGLSVDSTREVTRRYLRRGVAAYALVQPDGNVRVYTGAYENAEQAALAAPALRRAGVEPVLAYRVGRPR